VKRLPRVRPRFVNGKVQNWNDLRSASITGLVKTLPRVGGKQLKTLVDLALSEAQCPNNVAVALAATLEDDLPDKADAGQIGSLYEKGGDCLTNPDDKESALTRAGLFFYLKKELPRASRTLQKSSDIDAAKSPRPLYWLYQIGTELSDKSTSRSALRRLKEKYPFSMHTILARLTEHEDPDDILQRNEPSPLKRSQKAPRRMP